MHQGTWWHLQMESKVNSIQMLNRISIITANKPNKNKLTLKWKKEIVMRIQLRRKASKPEKVRGWSKRQLCTCNKWIKMLKSKIKILRVALKLLAAQEKRNSWMIQNQLRKSSKRERSNILMKVNSKWRTWRQKKNIQNNMMQYLIKEVIAFTTEKEACILLISKLEKTIISWDNNRRNTSLASLESTCSALPQMIRQAFWVQETNLAKNNIQLVSLIWFHEQELRVQEQVRLNAE